MEIKHYNLNKNFNIKGEGTLDVFIQESNKPLILVCPGGGYTHLSTREALPVVNKFLSFGYNSALLKYSVEPYSYPTQLNEINACIKHLLSINNNLFIVGFSAGGHLTGLGGTDIYQDKIKGLILCYPVISLGEHTHLGSQQTLLKDMNTLENQIKFSINNRVTKSTPKTFIWCTNEDKTVPPINCQLMVDALNKYGIYNEFVIYPHGPHGMALADETATTDGHEDCYSKEVQTWIYKAKDFIEKVMKND